MTITYILLSVLVVSLISLVGVVTLGLNKSRLTRAMLLLVSFAVGALLGDAFLHLIPESIETLGNTPFVSGLILLGVLIFFALEKFVRWHHCHRVDDDETHHHHPVATMNLIGDGVHNFIDGMLIAVSYIAGIPIGIATTIAVILHEIPSEIGDFGVLVHSGFSVQKAVLYNFFSALFAIVGAVLVILLGGVAPVEYLLPITAGGFIYIAGADLIPELHHETNVAVSLKQLVAIILGMAIMTALLFLE